MRIKSYFAGSVQEAIERARLELGPDAMLMNSKKTEVELRALGDYEVVFGVTSETAVRPARGLPAPRPKPATAGVMHAQIAPAPAAAAQMALTQTATTQTAMTQIAATQTAPMTAGKTAVATRVPTRPGGLAISKGLAALLQAGRSFEGQPEGQGGEWGREMAELRQQIESVRKALTAQEAGARQPESMPRELAVASLSAGGPDAVFGDAPRDGFSQRANATDAASMHEICEHLTGLGFSASLAVEIAEGLQERLYAGANGSGAAEPADGALRVELASRFAVAPGLRPAPGAPDAGGPHAVLFAGPAGAGKTASLIKLALRHSLGARLPLQILSLDTLRVGGWEQLAAYARIAGLPFDVVHTPAGLGSALTEHAGKKLILIDTPGLSPAEWRQTPELTEWVTREQALEVHLVLPAVLRPRAAARAMEQFAVWRPAKLLLTHLDEVDEPGVPLELAMRSGLPLSYLASGQQIPEDIEEASKERLLDACARQVSTGPDSALLATRGTRQVATAA